MSFVQSTIKNTRSLSGQNKASATVTTSGLLYDLTSGLLTEATSSSTRNTVVGVANLTASAADAVTQALCIDLDPEDVWVADSTNNSNTGHNGQAMIIGANGGVVDNTGTTSAVGVVVQVGTFGATTDKKILVRFITV